MQHEIQWVTSKDNKQLFLRRWFDPSRQPRAIIHISHGMGDHSARYEKLAEKLVQLDCVVFANDHRGHGETGKKDLLGHYADKNGWELLVDDLDRHMNEARKYHPTLPVILLGHSMGCAIAQAYAINHGEKLAGLILSGPNYGMPAFFGAVQLVAKAEGLRVGSRTPSKLINHLSFSSFNNRFRPSRTEFDWLSRDHKQVDLYVDDPWCGFMCTPQLWSDFLGGLQQIFQRKNQQKIPKKLPIYILGGDKDPVGAGGKALMSLVQRFQDIGIEQITYHLYHDARHEMFNETNCEEVYSDLIDWLQKNLPGKP